MCRPATDYAHLITPMPGDRPRASARRLERASTETEREAILQGPAPYATQVARAIARGDARRALLTAAAALGLPDCPAGCGCRGTAS